MERVETLIVGGGVAGLATARALALRGARGVLLVEREATLATQSSGRNAAILRTFTGDAPTTELALRTATFLAAPPPGFADVPLLDPCGLVLVPDPAKRAALAAWRALKAPGAVTDLDDGAFRAMVPGWRGATAGAFLVRDEGRIDTSALLDGLAAGARAGGVELRTGADVVELMLEGGACHGARLADGALVEATTTVLAGGGWAATRPRTAASRVRLHPRRRHLLATAPDARVDPRGPVVWSDPDGFYMRPESGGLLLCACDEAELDPDRCEADAAVREAIAEKTARLVPELADARAAHFWCGLRTFTDDAGFVVGRDPDLPGLAWVAGLGGHGMSTSVALGELAARTLTEPAAELEREPLARALEPARFAAPLAAGGA